VQFRFAHGAFESKQQSIVEMCGIVEPVLVKNERVREGADFKQTVPVGGIAS
jgi:hypothetical protein